MRVTHVFPRQLSITFMHFQTSSSFDWFIGLLVFEQETQAPAAGDFVSSAWPVLELDVYFTSCAAELMTTF